MKRLLFSTLSSLFVLFANAQDSVIYSLDSQTFRRLLNHQFTTLVAGQAKNSIGNFATLDLNEPELAFAGSAITKNNSVLTMKVAGGVSDGLFKIFNNSTLNTKVSVDLQFHLLGSGPQSLTYESTSAQRFNNKVNALTHKYKLDSIALSFGRDSIELMVKRDELENKRNNLQRLFNDEPPGRRKDSLHYELAIAQFKLDSTSTAVALLEPDFMRMEKLDNAYAMDLEANTPDIKISGFRLGWWSVGYKVRNDAFKLFDPKLFYSDQLNKQSFVSHEASVQFSRYRWSIIPNKSFFWQAGIAFSYSHNLDELTQTEITEVKNFGPNIADRTSTDKYNVYVGEYENNLKGLRLYYDYYRFLFSDNTAAIHGFPEVMIRDKTRPLYNLGFGFLLSFKDEKEEKDKSARVNAELYYKFLDLFRYSESEDKFLERNEIGLRFTFPIKFKTN